jgi:hypothetical protein
LGWKERRSLLYRPQGAWEAACEAYEEGSRTETTSGDEGLLHVLGVRRDDGRSQQEGAPYSTALAFLVPRALCVYVRVAVAQ